MKNYWMIILFGLAAASLELQAEIDELECDCPSCREKAASGKEFTLPGLQGLEEDHVEQASLPAHAQAEEGQAGLPAPHAAHEGHAHDASDHGDDACCPAETVAAVPHDHDGDGVSDHASHDDPAVHGSHEGHDHGAHADEGIKLPDEIAATVGLTILEAHGGTIAQASTFPAEIKLNRDATAAVSPRYASIVHQVFAEIGDEVKGGDTLARLENRETMATYTVTAPLDGVVISKNIAMGETAAEDKVLFEVADLSTVWADISIFPQYQHLIRKGVAVTFTAHDGHRAMGVIKYISPIVSPETRTFTARCVLHGAGEDFTPGAFVRAGINVEAVDASVVVPREAVQWVDGEPVVFVPGAPGFITVPVQIGLTDQYSVEIKSGLRPGDQYVAGGAFVLKAELITGGMDPHAGHGH